MNLTLDRDALLPLLARADKIAPRNSTVPIISHVLLTADGQTLRIGATDLDMRIDASCAADVGEAGACAVRAETLHAFARSIRGGAQFSMSLKDGNLVVKSGRARASLVTMAADTYPEWETPEAAPVAFRMPAKALAAALRGVAHAQSNEESRIYLNGVFMTVEPGDPAHLAFVSTDGGRLARVRYEAPENAAHMPQIILPSVAVAEIIALCDGADGDATIASNSQTASVSLAARALHMKLIGYTYPDYLRVIPAGNDKIVHADPKAIVEALRTVAIAADERAAPGVICDVEAGRMKFASHSLAVGTIREECEVDYDGAPLQFGVNAKYLLDALAQVETDSIRIALADSMSPIHIRAAADNARDFVVMPRRQPQIPADA